MENKEIDAANEKEKENVSESEEIKNLKDKWLRALADLDNYKKRFNRELDRMCNIDREIIFREILHVVDNLERALSSEGAEKNPLFEGVEATYQLLLSILKKFGVEQFNPQNQIFNPDFHEAVATANIPTEEEGKIIEVIQMGYKINNNILRHAKVIPVKHL